MSKEYDFGFTTYVPEEAAPVKDYEERLLDLYQAIVPFLDNLAKDPHKDIHWPNRDVKIAEFKQKLLDIVDGTYRSRQENY